MTYPLGPNEAQRLLALDELEILGSSADPAIDHAVALACDLFQATAAMVTLVAEDKVWLKAAHGIDEQHIARDASICNWTILTDDLFVVEDAATRPELDSIGLLPGGKPVRFYAGVPLSIEPGLRLGALCIVDAEPRDFGNDDRRRLRDIAAMVEGQLRLHRRMVDGAEQDRAFWRLANEDPLTGLGNRSQFKQRFDDALLNAASKGTGLSLLLLDIDHFKDVNDVQGHDAGDAMLEVVAERLRKFVTENDMLARIGGDEFALLMVDPGSGEHAEALAAEMLARLAEPFPFGQHTIYCRASVGIASYPRDHHTQAQLFKDADLALFRAKQMGRNQVCVYQPEMRADVETRIRIGTEIDTALHNGEIVPFYQPKISMKTGLVTGFEALARWQHPNRGLLTPGYFGCVFADPERAKTIGKSIVMQVAADIRSWCDKGIDCGRVAVNLSSAEFFVRTLATDILEILHDAGVANDRIEIEVTETVLLDNNLDQVCNTLQYLKDAGITISLDDFGTGFASLKHLKQFPIDSIKIDKSFVLDLDNSDSAAIVATVIGLGKGLNIAVTAEGVETLEHADVLRGLGCDHAQGYYYAKPMAATRVPWMLKNWIVDTEMPASRRMTS